MKTINNKERLSVIYTSLLGNHERVTQSGDVKLVRFAFLVNDPEGRKKLTPDQAIVHARLLKSLIRLYFNKYRRRRSGKRVLGYSWVMHTEQYRNKPYLHIVFYVTSTAYDEMMPEPRNEAQVMLPDVSNDSVEKSSLNVPESVLSVISDLGHYWTVICQSKGYSGAAVSYNIDKGRYQLSHGEHPHLDYLKDFDIFQDLNDGHEGLVTQKLDISGNRVYLYLRLIASEAYFLPKERSFGVSYRGKKEVSENVPLTIPETGNENGIKKALNDDL